MIRNILILLLCAFLFSCSSGGHRSAADTAKSARDSMVSTNKTFTVTQDDPGPSPADILKSCLQNYRVITTIDTVLRIDSGALTVHLRHYCAYDNGIILPEKYAKLFGLKTFATQNFVTDVLISKNAEPVYTGRITKADFLPLLDDELKKYGSLLFIDRRLFVSRSGKGVVINYSLSIPLTDVGRTATIAIEPNGSKQVFLSYGEKAEKAFPANAVKPVIKPDTAVATPELH
jgi:hypothetical protein